MWLVYKEGGVQTRSLLVMFVISFNAHELQRYMFEYTEATLDKHLLSCKVWDILNQYVTFIPFPNTLMYIIMLQQIPDYKLFKVRTSLLLLSYKHSQPIQTINKK